MFILILILEAVAALSMGMLVSAAAATPELALGIGIPLTIVTFLFAGFYSTSIFCCCEEYCVFVCMPDMIHEDSFCMVTNVCFIS